MNKTKIDWCDCTVNPVVGCPRGCAYCYAKKINDRFHIVPDFSKPQFFPERLKQFESKKPKSIFINSMSDVAYWGFDWFVAILEAMRANPQHNYITLTKDAMGLWDLNHPLIDDVPLFQGLTLTRQRHFFEWYETNKVPDFFNVEPILEPIELGAKEWVSDVVKAVIIGAETGNRKGKIIPKKEWIDNLVRQADERGLRIFMKESLRGFMGADFRQDELIWRAER